MAGAWGGYAEGPGASAESTPAPSATALPAWAVLALGSLTLTCLGLLALLVLGAQPPPAGAPSDPVDAAGAVTPEPEPDAAPAVEDSAPQPAPAGADGAASAFAADPQPIPTDLITRLEASSNEPLQGELRHLLAAVQHGFGSESAQLEPTLRSYAYRMASRFEWNPDTFRVAVTAPSPALADARAATLRRLFGDAVASRRLVIRSAAGPNALSLVPR
ncbi:MAG TPA: hypothetical protein VF576_14325 [Rubricoccaceae bacterium]